MEQAERQTKVAEAAKTIEATKAATPDVPPHIGKCLEAGARERAVRAKAAAEKKEPTADQLVTARMQSDEERRLCASALLAWYREIQKANVKTAATAPKTVKK